MKAALSFYQRLPLQLWPGVQCIFLEGQIRTSWIRRSAKQELHLLAGNSDPPWGTTAKAQSRKFQDEKELCCSVYELCRCSAWHELPWAVQHSNSRLWLGHLLEKRELKLEWAIFARWHTYNANGTIWTMDHGPCPFNRSSKCIKWFSKQRQNSRGFLQSRTKLLQFWPSSPFPKGREESDAHELLYGATRWCQSFDFLLQQVHQ